MDKCGYVCFFRGRKVEVYADSSYQAQQQAAKLFKVKPNKEHEITVVLAEKPGPNGPETVKHTPVD